MHKFVRNLLTEWRKVGLPFEDAAIVVAVSGGADSVSLLLALEDLHRRGKLKLDFIVAHLNHRLRAAESDADADFVKQLSDKLGFLSVHRSLTVNKRGNLEQNARRARYEFLEETALKNHAVLILTAHTLNDQAETLLINLIRGSGIDGLAGMNPVADRLKTKIVRPLLNWAARAETEDYCRERNVEFRNDSMNDDLNFTRVRIRRELLPALAEYNPRIVETLANTAKLLRFELDAEGVGVAFENVEKLDIKELKKLAEADVFKLLRNWLKSRRGDLRGLGLKHFEAIRRLTDSRKSGRVVELPGGETVVRKNGELLWIRGIEENDA